jgi:3-hydroxybutyryl-CoA dehydrogenase
MSARASEHEAASDPPRAHVAIVGAGLMGSQIGSEYALGGCHVTWVVRDRARSEQRVERALAVARDHGLADEPALARARASMSYGESDARSPQLIVESLPEDLSVKAEVLGELAERYPQATIASNTSSLSISALGEAAGVGGRIVGTHYWNPPLLMPLVETIAGRHTPRELLVAVLGLLRAIGKRPIVLEREATGLLWNRLQLAVLRECEWLVEHGVATPQTIDEVMRDGLARRWRLTGPFETVGLGGAETFDAIAANLFPLLSSATVGRGFERHVPSDPSVLARLRERRDDALAAELRSERSERAS